MKIYKVGSIGSSRPFQLDRSSPTFGFGCPIGLGVLGINDLHNSMTLSTLSISSRDFVLGFAKRLEIVFIDYKPMIIP